MNYDYQIFKFKFKKNPKMQFKLSVQNQSLLHILNGYIIFHREYITFSSPSKLYLFYLENLLTPKLQFKS